MLTLPLKLSALGLVLLLAGTGRAAAQSLSVASHTTALASATPLADGAALPQTVQLRGVVRLPTGKPCPGASVYPAGAARQLVVTDQNGAFMLPVPVGTPVSLRVEYFGEGSSRVELPQPTTELLSITLGQ